MNRGRAPVKQGKRLGRGRPWAQQANTGGWECGWGEMLGLPMRGLEFYENGEVLKVAFGGGSVRSVKSGLGKEEESQSEGHCLHLSEGRGSAPSVPLAQPRGHGGTHSYHALACA